MKDQSFTAKFSVDQSPREVIDAINNVRGWWSEEIEGGTKTPGDEFIYRYRDVHRSHIRVTEVVPDRKVSWLVLDNYFNFTEDQTEWTGTTIEFDVAALDAGVEVRFTHRGLVPEHECFESCSAGWGFYVNSSLRSLIATGKGQPNGKEQPEIADEDGRAVAAG